MKSNEKEDATKKVNLPSSNFPEEKQNKVEEISPPVPEAKRIKVEDEQIVWVILQEPEYSFIMRLN